MIEFINNNNVSFSMSVLFFYANKFFYSRISFNFDTIDYIIIRKRLNTIKAKDIINYMQDVLVYIRENLNKIYLIIIE